VEGWKVGKFSLPIFQSVASSYGANHGWRTDTSFSIQNSLKFSIAEILLYHVKGI
jgi:hypothetical protein